MTANTEGEFIIIFNQETFTLRKKINFMEGYSKDYRSGTQTTVFHNKPPKSQSAGGLVAPTTFRWCAYKLNTGTHTHKHAHSTCASVRARFPADHLRCERAAVAESGACLSAEVSSVAQDIEGIVIK